MSDYFIGVQTIVQIFLTSTNSQHLTNTSQGRLKEAGLPIEGRARIPGLHVIIFNPNLRIAIVSNPYNEAASRAGESCRGFPYRYQKPCVSVHSLNM